MLIYNDTPSETRRVETTWDGVRFDDATIKEMELKRARRSLAYLKERIGNDGMRELLADDLDATTAQVRQWTEDSNGEWRSGALNMVVPGPSSEYFEDWFMGNMRDQHEALFRAGHPDHFMNHPTGPGAAEVFENVGEDELPWHIFLDFRGRDFEFPTPWEDGYPHAFGVIISDRDGLRIGSAMHELRDTQNGDLAVKLTIHLPSAAPESLIAGHLRHFTIEFRNWTEMAARDADPGRTSSSALAASEYR